MSYRRPMTRASRKMESRKLLTAQWYWTGGTESIQMPMPNAQPAMNIAISVNSIGSL